MAALPTPINQANLRRFPVNRAANLKAVRATEGADRRDLH